MPESIPFEQIVLRRSEKLFLSSGSFESVPADIDVNTLVRYGFLAKSWNTPGKVYLTPRYRDYCNWNINRWRDRLFRFISGFASGVFVTVVSALLLRLF